MERVEDIGDARTRLCLCRSNLRTGAKVSAGEKGWRMRVRSIQKEGRTFRKQATLGDVIMVYVPDSDWGALRAMLLHVKCDASTAKEQGAAIPACELSLGIKLIYTPATTTCQEFVRMLRNMDCVLLQ